MSAEPLFPGARRLLFVDAPTGIAGDMFLAALSGLHFELEPLPQAFARAGVEIGLSVEKVQRHGLEGLLLNASLPHEHVHRGLADCLRFLDQLELPPPAHALAADCFRRLAKEEGLLHGLSPDEVHFHEVGALDSLLDIAGAALGLYTLGVARVHLRDLGVGRGTAGMAHGTLPLPAPATMSLLRGASLRETGIEAELVTPTGALILACTAEPVPAGLRWQPLLSAYGAGRRELPDRPNLLRLTLADPVSADEPDGLATRELMVLRCTVDDMNPERCTYLMELLFENGARDVHYRPLQMKKNRPGLEIEVLCAGDALAPLQTLLLRETSTLGLRIAREDRVELPRELGQVETPYGQVGMKVALLPDGSRRAAPEYEDCAALARKHGVPLAEVEEAARSAWRRGREDA